MYYTLTDEGKNWPTFMTGCMKLQNSATSSCLIGFRIRAANRHPLLNEWSNTLIKRSSE
ncbi:hypothetical protein PO124_21090 [Bacillus licheniformis]|nr:hypothetical protein [Bacillus licheniformis]